MCDEENLRPWTKEDEGCLFFGLPIAIILIIGFYFWFSYCVMPGIHAEEIKQNKQDAVLKETFSPSKILDVHYARTLVCDDLNLTIVRNNVEHMVVTIVNSKGERKNIYQHWEDQIPLVGETWSVDIKDHRLILDKRVEQ